MTKLKDVCRHVRSKQAGPFWITFDIFFDGEENFEKYHKNPALLPKRFANVYGVDSGLVKYIPVPYLKMVKISCPRSNPQGGMVERDMHAGQQYIRLLEIKLD